MLKKLILFCALASSVSAERITLGVITDVSWNGTMIVWGGNTNTPPPPAEPVEITFDYNYFDANMVAAVEFATSNYPPAQAFGYLPTCESLGPRFSFSNWQDSSSTIYTTESTVPGTATALHASFTDAGASSYSLTFDLQSGSGDTPSIPLWDGWTYSSGDYGDGSFPANPTKDGYAFAGWYTQSGNSGTQIYPSTTYYNNDATTLYAFWAYQLTFDLQGGTGDTPILAIMYGWNYGQGYNFFPAEPTKDGYTFNGWWTEEDGEGSSITPSGTSESYSHVTAYAWWVNFATVSFSYTVHDANMQASLSFGSAQFIVGNAYGADSSVFPTVSSGPRYTADAWYDSTDAAVLYSDPVPSGDNTLHVHFTDNIIYASGLGFDLQGGTGDTPSINLYTGWALQAGDYGNGSFPADPTYEGYTFGGWFTEAGGQGTQMYASDLYNSYFGGTLFAYWIAN
jgi:uncharacterized repeat protein (TIGR02543 family)